MDHLVSQVFLARQVPVVNQDLLDHEAVLDQQDQMGKEVLLDLQELEEKKDYQEHVDQMGDLGHQV